MEKLTSFSIGGSPVPVKHIQDEGEIYAGVNCDVYAFEDDTTKDLAVVRVEAGGFTPPQLVLKGEKTTEQFISGKGALVVVRKNGKSETFDGKLGLSVDVFIGDKMQWVASEETELVFAEICMPPYEEGRFENLDSL